MLKIKNHIYNENEIISINESTENDSISIKFKTDSYFILENATFEDIEWNYGEDENNKLRAENKELIKTNMELAIKNKELREKINFAENILYDYLYKDEKITEELYLKYKGEE